MAARMALVLLACMLVSLAPAGPARAQCAPGAGPEGSPVVFVGEAHETVRGHTRFTVREVRSGPDLAVEVWVQSGQEGPGVASGLDVAFVEGELYVVGASEDFVTDDCQVSQSGGETTASGREPVAGGATGSEPPAVPTWFEDDPAPLVFGAVLIVGAGVWLTRRARSRRFASLSRPE